jgi:tetratricopeptide (TPR) repeat protein
VLTTLANLAGVYDGLGDTDRALATLLDALRTAESMPDTGTTLLGLCNNIGATYQDLGRDEEAAPYLRRAAALALEQLGPDHPTTLSIQGNLAGLESDLGAPERAAELYRALAEARAASLGPAALDTLVARYGYWNSLWSAGHFEESAAGFEDLLADVVDAFGETHWLKAQTQSSLARALLDCGRASEALELAIEAEAQLEKLFGSDHHRTQSARAVVEAVRSASSGG